MASAAADGAAVAAATTTTAGDKMRAVVLSKAGDAVANFAVGEWPKPSIKKGNLLVKIKSASVNPVDWKRAAFGFALPTVPAVVGLDCCGVVEEVGEGVTKFKKGDVVFAWAPTGAAEGFGCWAEYGLFDETHLTLKPDTWTEDETPCLGVTGLTALQGLFHESALGLNLPSKPISDEQFVLIWGATSGVGQLATQLAAAAGYTVIATCSAKNNDLVKGNGATHVFDYHDDDVVAKITEAAGGKLYRAFDTASNGDQCVAAMSTDAPAIVRTIAGQTDKSKVPDNVDVKGFLVAAPSGSLFDPDAALVDFLFKAIENEVFPLIKAGKFKPLPVLNVGGLDTMLEGVKKSHTHSTGGKKVVFNP